MIGNDLNPKLVELVGLVPSRILHFNCGSGRLGQTLKSRAGHDITGCTSSNEEAQQANEILDQVYLENPNDFSPDNLGGFDIIICSHVLHQVFEPGQFLHRLRRALKPDGKIIITLANALWWRQRWQFFRGEFRYSPEGLLDRSHYRFFDYQAAQRMIREAGFTISQKETIGEVPLSGMLDRLPKKYGLAISEWATGAFPGLFGRQFLFVCHSF